MSSSCGTRWTRFSHRLFPFLYKQCPEGNWHRRRDQVCYCRVGEHVGGWHGGVYDFGTGGEYRDCKACVWVGYAKKELGE